MGKLLFLITSIYPYEETFLVTEIQYLSKKFQKIIIISNHPGNNKELDMPNNVEVVRHPYELSKKQKLFSIFQILSPLFWKEFSSIRKKHKISKTVINTMLLSLVRGKKANAFLIETSNKYKSDCTLHVYNYWCNDMALGTALFHKSNPHIKCISRTHGSDVYHEASACNYLPYRSFIANNLSTIYTISNYGKQYIQKEWGNVSKAAITISKLGVNNSFGINTSIKKDNNLKIISCSSFSLVKRLDLLIKAFSLIKNFNIEWIHIGNGELQNEIIQLAKTTLTASNINFTFTDRIKNRELFKLYNSINADLFINVSSTEGIPVSIMEAISFGTPIIATNVGAVNEIVNEKNGILLPPNPSPEQIAFSISNFNDLSPEAILKMRKASRFKWETDYKAEENYSNFTNKIITKAT